MTVYSGNSRLDHSASSNCLFSHISQGPDRFSQPKRFQNDARRSGGSGPREYCSTCGKWIDGGFEQHKSSREHLEKLGRKNLPVAGKNSSQSTPETNRPAAKISAIPPKKEAAPQVKKPEAAVQPTKNINSSNGSLAANIDEEQEGTVEEVSDIPEYDETVCLGREYVLPVTGYFCRLCHKFYSSETTVFESHCHSRPHYDKYIAELEHLRNKNGVASSAGQKSNVSSGTRRGNTKA